MADTKKQNNKRIWIFVNKRMAKLPQDKIERFFRFSGYYEGNTAKFEKMIFLVLGGRFPRDYIFGGIGRFKAGVT